MKFTKGSYINTLPCGNQCSQECFADVSKSSVTDYIALLLENGYTQQEISTPNGNIFTTLTSKDELIHLSYFKHDNTLKILRDPLLETVYKTAEPQYKKITNTTLAIIPLDYTHREIKDAHGMSYVITLEDGRYIIIDGGYGDYVRNNEKVETRDAEILYEYLKNNKKTDSITIAAWIFTHPHEDHYGAFTKFTKLYGNTVEIQYFIYNNGDFSTYSEQYPPDNFLQKNLPEIIKSNYPHSKTLKPHIGQSIQFCNLNLCAIFTQEVCIPYLKPTANDASLVLRMTVNGKSVLFMADCDTASTNLITTIYQNSLKSDYMQVNHHGYSGATCTLYDCVSPDYTLWTTSKTAFDKRVSGEKYEFIGNAVESNKYIFDKLGYERCIIADNDIQHIIF